MDNSILHKSAHFCKCTCSLKRSGICAGCTFVRFVWSSHMCVHICTLCMCSASRLYIKWSATHAHVHRNSIGDEVVGYLCPFIHWSPIQCGVTLDSVWHTVIHTMIHFGTLSHTAHFGTGHWHTESSHRSSVAWQQPAETQHSTLPTYTFSKTKTKNCKMTLK